MEHLHAWSEQFLQQLPQLLKPIAILVVGWILVSIVASLVRRLLGKTRIDNLIAEKLLGGDKAAKVNVERSIGRVVYVIGLVFVAIAFLEAMQLRSVSEPLNRFLGALFDFVPRVLGGIALVVVAWVVATLVRTFARRVLDKLRVDDKLASNLGETSQVGLSRTVSETLYWAVFLLFLPAVLDALALEGALGPIQSMLNDVLSALPNILSAGIIFAVGMFAARIVQRVVTNLLVAANVDRFARSHGADWTRKPSELVGLFAYALVLIPVAIAGLGELGLDAITQPASAMLSAMLNKVPDLLGAALILTIAYLVGKLLGGIVASLLAGVGFDVLPAKLGLSEPASDARKPSAVVGTLVPIVLVVLAIVEALDTLGLNAAAEIVARLIDFGARVLLGTVVIAIGLYFGRIVADAVRGSQLPQAGSLATVARVAVLVLATTMGLSEMGVADDIIRLAFGLSLGALAVAAALSFGLGGREAAAQLLRRWTAPGIRPLPGSKEPQ